MTQFIKLNEVRYPQPVSILINLSLVEKFECRGESTAVIFNQPMAERGYCPLLVEETPEQILALIEGKEF